MNTQVALFLSVFVAATAPAAAPADESEAEKTHVNVVTEPMRPLNRRPNIILMMCDDIGWGDFNVPRRMAPIDPSCRTQNPLYTNASSDSPMTTGDCADLNLRTTNIENLASGGLRFHRFYSQASVCTPTRASFQTGRHHARMEILGINKPILNRELLISEIAKALGYKTAHYGKWHLGKLGRDTFNPDGTVTPVPDGGNIGTFNGHGLNGVYTAPWHHGYDESLTFQRAVQTWEPYERRNGINGPPRSHFWTGHAQYIPDDGTLSDLYTCQILTDAAIDFATANQDDPFFITIWYQTGHNTWNSDPSDTTFDDCTNGTGSGTHQDGYLTSLYKFDQQIGLLRAKLAELDLLNDTLILLTSDNGPEGGGGSNGGLSERKRSIKEGGVRVPGIFSWQGTIDPDSETFAIASVTDLLPTLLDIWAVEKPDDRPLDGESILPVLLGLSGQRQSGIIRFPNFPPGGKDATYTSADGKWKIFADDYSRANPAWKLYDLHCDPIEEDPISQHPMLEALLEQWQAAFDGIEPGIARDFPAVAGSDSMLDFADDDYPEGIVNADEFEKNQQVIVDATSPWDFRPDAMEHTKPRVILERQYATLQSDMIVNSDASTPTTYTPGPLSPLATIPAGTVVFSHLVHFDRPDGSSPNRDFTITLTNDIVGIAWERSKLATSDSLAFSKPVFEPATGKADNRGTLDSPGDSIQLVDARTLTIHLQTPDHGDRDQVRIITRAPLQYQPPPCAADLNNDGQLTPADTELYLAEFAADNMNVDIAEPFGVLDSADTSRFTELVTAGCP